MKTSVHQSIIPFIPKKHDVKIRSFPNLPEKKETRFGEKGTIARNWTE